MNVEAIRREAEEELAVLEERRGFLRDLLKTLDKHQPSEVHPCPHCDFEAKAPQGLAAHIRQRHET